MHKPKIAIIGAGWTGCHLALSLKNTFDITLFEQGSSVFAGASGNNQNRLHLGFHYPRNTETIAETKQSFESFMKHYSHLIIPFENNYYAIAERDSYLDFESYCRAMEKFNNNYEVIPPKDSPFNNLQGLLRCPEKVIHTQKAAQYFHQELQSILRLNTTIETLDSQKNGVKVNSETFDLALNCTYNQFHPFSGQYFFYETCLMTLYKPKTRFNPFALTVMDGPFGSIYPVYMNDEMLYTFSSVSDTPYFKTACIKEAKDSLNLETLKERQIRKSIEEKMMHYYPGLLKDFSYHDVVKSVKTKLNNNPSEQRVFLTHQEDRIIHFFSPKISSVMPYTSKIEKQLKTQLSI